MILVESQFIHVSLNLKTNNEKKLGRCIKKYMTIHTCISINNRLKQFCRPNTFFWIRKCLRYTYIILYNKFSQFSLEKLQKCDKMTSLAYYFYQVPCQLYVHF